MFPAHFEHYIPQSMLLIEDDADMAQYLTQLLITQQNPIQIVTVNSLAAARPYLLGEHGIIDLVLTDLNLEDSSGMTTLQQIRLWRADVPVVVITGSQDEGAGIAALQQGAQDFLLKDDALPNMLYRVLIYACYRFEQENELRLAKQQTDAANASKDKFVALIAHDVRGPLGTISGLASVLQDNEPGALLSQYQEVVSGIKNAADDLLNLLEDVLELSKLKTGKVTPRKKFVDAHILANLAIRRLKLLANNKQLTLNNLIPPGTRLFADETLIIQVLQNLISNAIKFSFPGKSIDIFLPHSGQTTVAVKDEGVGIKPERITNLLKIEEKTTSTGTSGERGTGLGLPLIAEIITAHAGQINIQSEPAQGSTISFTIPAVQPMVMIVDDDRISRQIQALHLKNLNVNIQQAASGSQALEMLQTMQPDLMLIDISMPEMSGFELLSKLRNNPKCEKIPVIMVTADDHIETRQQALREGADDFVLKPIVPHDMIPRVQRFIV